MSRPLPQKLGFRDGMRTRVAGLPEALAGPLAPLVAAAGEPADLLLFFVPDRATLPAAAAEAVAAYRRGGHLWFPYPKKSGRIRTDIDRDHGWEAVSALDLHGVTQVALDSDWSALRFRYRDEIASFTRKF